MAGYLRKLSYNACWLNPCFQPSRLAKLRRSTLTSQHNGSTEYWRVLRQRPGFLKDTIMRKQFVPLLIAGITLAGCNSSPQSQTPSKNAAAAVPAITSITGTVNYRQKIPLSADARLDVSLVDVNQQSVVIAQKTFAPISAVPASFELPIDVSKIVPKDIYVIKAVLLDGERRFVPALEYPVLTKGGPVKVDILLNPESTASEKLNDDFRKLENNIGAMIRITGSRETTDYNLGWDAFYSNNDLRFLRETVDIGEKGRTSSKYAFNNGKVWMMVKQDFAENGKSPTLTTRLGWNDAGELILKEKGNDEATLDDIKALTAAANAAAATANARKAASSKH